jgi:hypothetical protein
VTMEQPSARAMKPPSVSSLVIWNTISLMDSLWQSVGQWERWFITRAHVAACRVVLFWQDF